MRSESHDLHAHAAPIAPGRLGRTAATVYGVLLLVWLAIPGPLAQWCDDHADWPPARVLGTVAHGVEDLSRRLGLATVYEAGRDGFTRLLDP